jgi:hypothetical protein
VRCRGEHVFQVVDLGGERILKAVWPSLGKFDAGAIFPIPLDEHFEKSYEE